jgi:Fungalysin metallopeptidase (M36)
MKSSTRWMFLALILTVTFTMLVVPPRTSSFQERESPLALFDDYDIRYDASENGQSGQQNYLSRLSASQKQSLSDLHNMMVQAEKKMKDRIPGLKVDYDEALATPAVVGVDLARGFLTRPSTDRHESIVRTFVSQNSALYALTTKQVGKLTTSADYTNPAGNLSWVELQQELNGIPVFQGRLLAALTRNGEVVRTTSSLLSGVAEENLSTTPEMNAAAAASAAARTIGVNIDANTLLAGASPGKDARTTLLPAGPFTDEISSELVYFPIAPGVATLAHSMLLWGPNIAYWVIVDADNGQLLWRKNITQDQTQTATYSVYDGDSPAPLSPITATAPGQFIQPPGIARTTFTLVSELPAFDNLGWITDGGNVTTGNNVDAGLDIVAPNGIDPTGRATGSPNRVFDFPYNPPPNGADSPSDPNYQMGVVTHLFFWTNRYHDVLYQLGFTEAARNFQTNNFGRGGLGNDFVRAEAQDSSGTNNANFATGADGALPRMQMFLWPSPSPTRDGDLDADVFLHELTHGTSNRLHNNASGLGGQQGGGMGEGWGDFVGRSMLSSADENVDGLYAPGAYVLFNLGAMGADNYYYGIRRFPYASIGTLGPNGKPYNPESYGDIDPSKQNMSDGAFTRNPAIGSPQSIEVHNIGDVWCSMLLEVRARVIHRLGWAVGNQRMLQLVIDGMKLDPNNPTILQARDALIAADMGGFGGADVDDIWAGFALRGAGFNAQTNTAANISVTESFITPNLILGSVPFSDASGNNNGFADPGETLTLTVPLRNLLPATATGASASVVGGGTESYGDIANGVTTTRTISYTVPLSAVCGSRLQVPVNIASSLGPSTQKFPLVVGQPVAGYTENYDGVTAPALPTGWTTSHTGAEVDWVVSSTGANSMPNSAFAPDVAANGETFLVSPVVHINSAAAQLSFKNLFNLHAAGNTTGNDGMVLEASIDGGPFIDILETGGIFVSGAYTRSMVTTTGFPIRGRGAWTGLSGGTTAAPTFVNTVINLPATMAGQDVQFRWRVACDAATIAAGTAGVRIDDIAITTDSACTSAFTNAGGAITGESCAPANSSIDPGERATVHLNITNGGAATSNLIGTLQATGGVIAPGSPNAFGALPSGATVGADYTFTADGALTPGQTIVVTLQLQDGANDLGTVSFNFIAGPAPCGIVRLVVTSSTSRANATTVVTAITVQNIGALPANDVVVTTARLGSTNGTPLPQSLGSLAPGALTSTIVTFNNSTPGVISTLTVGGTYTGGTFTATKRITIP